jgi:glucose/arabinose dehydrogenase
MRRGTITALLVLAVVGACNDDDTGSGDDTVPAPTETLAEAAVTSTAADTTDVTTATTVLGAATTTPATGATSAAPADTPAPTPAGTTPPATVPEPVFGEPAAAAEQIADLDDPIGLAVRPGDDALYVIEQDGAVIKVAGSGESSEVAELDDRTDGGGEQGLLGIAFSPDGAAAYLNYTDRDGDTVVAEYPVAPDGAFDVGAERILLTIDQPYSNHNGGDLMVGPDGMLYIATGDGGSGGDPERRASDPTNLLGKLLRIDPTASADAPYTIPPDNPFASGSMGDLAGAPEVWSWGLRNPWKIAFDPVTAALWIADVGQNSIEEVNVADPTPEHPAGWGVDFGWSGFEGNARYNDDVPDPGNLHFPVWTYDHASGCSISGGAVYRGTAIAGLAPAYVYGDYCSGTVWAFDAASGRNVVLLEGMSNLAAVRTGPDGELYLVQQSDEISRLVTR